MKLGEDCEHTFSSSLFTNSLGYAVAQLVQALCYKPKEVIGIFLRLNPSGRTVALGSTQPLTETSIGEGGPCVGLTTLRTSYANCLESLGALTCWSPMSLSRPVME